ncbi:hypothetical protein QQ045_006326 [Rhodiola kirilowii]
MTRPAVIVLITLLMLAAATFSCYAYSPRFPPFYDEPPRFRYPRRPKFEHHKHKPRGTPETPSGTFAGRPGPKYPYDSPPVPSSSTPKERVYHIEPFPGV